MSEDDRPPRHGEYRINFATGNVYRWDSDSKQWNWVACEPDRIQTGQTQGRQGNMSWVSVSTRSGLPPSNSEWANLMRKKYGPRPDQNRKAGDST
jgi:hypothetical protein